MHRIPTIVRQALSSRWLVFLVTVVVHSLATRGGHNGADTPLYVSLADGFVSRNFSATLNPDRVLWTKTLYVSLVAAARTIAPSYWVYVMVAVNVVCSGVVAVLLVGLALRMSTSAAAPAIAFLAYLASYDVLQWMRYILTDPLYSATSFVPFYLIARRVLIDGEPRRPFLLVCSVIVAALSRPPGLFLIPLIAFIELAMIGRRIKPRTAVAIALIAASAVLFVRTAIVHDPSVWPTRFLRPKIAEVAEREKTGEVVWGQLASFRPPPKTAVDHVIMTGDRFVRFFQVTVTGFSRLHNLYSLLYFIPLYLLAAYGAFQAFRGSDRRRRLFVAVTLLWVGAYAFFYALTFLDYDWRFRAPLIPHLVLLAACGVDALVKALSREGVSEAGRGVLEENLAS